MKLVLEIILGVIIAIVLLIAALNKLGSWKYKPFREEIIARLKATMDGTIGLMSFDELCCVRIAYDKTLEQARLGLNRILDEKDSINRPHSKTKVIYLTEKGKEKIARLIESLEKQSNQLL